MAERARVGNGAVPAERNGQRKDLQRARALSDGLRAPAPPGKVATVSNQLINEYRAELDRLRAVSGSRRESVLREAFNDLLKRWGRARDLQFVAEHDIVTKQMNRIYVDGALASK